MVTTSSSRLASSPIVRVDPLPRAHGRQIELAHGEALGLGQQRQEAVLVAVDRQLLGDLGTHRPHAAADVVQGGPEQGVDRLVELAATRRLLEHPPGDHEIGAVQRLEHARQEIRCNLRPRG